MAEQNNIYSNAILSSTLDGMYRGLSGLYDIAVTQGQKLATEKTERTAADSALDERVTALQTTTGDNGSIATAIEELSTAIDTQATTRANDIASSLLSSKTYTDQEIDKLEEADTNLSTKISQVESALAATSGELAQKKLDASTFEETIANYKTSADTTTEITNAVKAEETRAIAKQTEIAGNVTALSTNLTTNYYNKTEVDAKVASVFKWMGSAESLQTIPTSGQVVGNVYQVGSTEYAWTGSKWEQLGLNVDMSLYATVEALNTEISAREEAVKDINAQIATINAQLGLGDGETEGESLTDRVKSLEDVIPTSAVPAGETILVTSNGKTVLNQLFNPGIALQFNGKSVGSGITSLNFAGTTTITVGEDGVAKVQIGENMNSSVWNAKDGKQGDGTPTGFPAGNDVIVSDVTGATFKVGNWTTGATVKGITTGTITIKSTGNIHLDEGTNTWTIKVYGATGNVVAEAVVNDTVTYNDATNPTSATVTTSAISGVTGTVTGITHSIVNGTGKLEDNYPAAVGGRGQVQFGFDLTKIDEIKNGGRFSIEIAGCGGTYKSAELFYIKQATPAIASATLSFNNDAATKTISGVKYIKSGTFTIETGNITNLNNQAGVSTKVTIAASNNFSDEDTAIISSDLTGYTTAWNNISTYKDTGLTLASNVKTVGGALSLTLTPKNAYTTGAAVSASTNGLNINTYAETDSPLSAELFLSENMRLANDLTAWTSTAILGAEDLQVIPGEGLVYPQTNYSTYTPANNPNYSTLTGTRYFTRKMSNGSGTKFGGTLTLAGLGNNWSKLTFAKLSIDGGATWFNLKADRGGADATGILNSYDSTSGNISFSFPGTTSMTAENGVHIKLGWSDKAVKITKITLSM